MTKPLRSFWRDAKFGMRLLRVLRLFSDLKPDYARTIADDFEDVIDAHPDDAAFVFEGKEVSYRQFEERGNRVANWALSQELKSGECRTKRRESKPAKGKLDSPSTSEFKFPAAAKKVKSK